MISAREAACITRNSEVLNKLDKCIRDSARSGYNEIRYEDKGGNFPDIVSDLNKLGYNVSKREYTFRGLVYKISW